MSTPAVCRVAPWCLQPCAPRKGHGSWKVAGSASPGPGALQDGARGLSQGPPHRADQTFPLESRPSLCGAVTRRLNYASTLRCGPNRDRLQWGGRGGGRERVRERPSVSSTTVHSLSPLLKLRLFPTLSGMTFACHHSTGAGLLGVKVTPDLGPSYSASVVKDQRRQRHLLPLVGNAEPSAQPRNRL